jgi:hypothetical protein
MQPLQVSVKHHRYVQLLLENYSVGNIPFLDWEMTSEHKSESIGMAIY